MLLVGNIWLQEVLLGSHDILRGKKFLPPPLGANLQIAHRNIKFLACLEKWGNRAMVDPYFRFLTSR